MVLIVRKCHSRIFLPSFLFFYEGVWTVPVFAVSSYIKTQRRRTNSFEEKKIHFKTFCCRGILLVWRHLWKTHLFPSKKCVRDLDWQSEMIIFESLLTTFEAIIISLDSWGSRKNWPDQITLSELVQIPDSKNMKIY